MKSESPVQNIEAIAAWMIGTMLFYVGLGFSFLPPGTQGSEFAVMARISLLVSLLLVGWSLWRPSGSFTVLLVSGFFTAVVALQSIVGALMGSPVATVGCLPLVCWVVFLFSPRRKAARAKFLTGGVATPAAYHSSISEMEGAVVCNGCQSMNAPNARNCYRCGWDMVEEREFRAGEK